jgi:hypothetical protein
MDGILDNTEQVHGEKKAKIGLKKRICLCEQTYINIFFNLKSMFAFYLSALTPCHTEMCPKQRIAVCWDSLIHIILNSTGT